MYATLVRSSKESFPTVIEEQQPTTVLLSRAEEERLSEHAELRSRLSSQSSQ